jgi:hypothetical protein
MTPNGMEYRAYGLAQWHKPFWELYQKWSGGKNIRGSSFMEQLGFLNWDLTHGPDRTIGNLIRANTNAAAAARTMSLYYERPAAGMAEADRRAAAAVHISQQTDIHMHGVKDAKAAGHEAAKQQRNVNAGLVRNFASVVQ